MIEPSVTPWRTDAATFARSRCKISALPSGRVAADGRLAPTGLRVRGEVAGIPHFNLLVEQLNAAFAAGTPSPWALDHLEVDLVGDFNQDNTVKAADYVAWRKGTGVAPSLVNHRRRQNNFGQVTAAASPLAPGHGSAVAGSAGGSEVPEPAPWFTVFLAAEVVAASRRRQWRRNRVVVIM